MKLRHIFISIELDRIGEFNDIRHPLNYQTRSLCNYLQKVLKHDEFTTNYKRLIFNCIINGEYSSDLVPGEYLRVNVPICLDEYKSLNLIELNKYFNLTYTLDSRVLYEPFSLKKYRDIPTDKVNEYFIGIIEKGIYQRCSEVELPCEQLKEGISRFRSNEYINKWILGPKTIGKMNATCQVDCELTIANFIARFKVLQDSKLIHSEVICSTLPDERDFRGKCKKMIIKAGSAIVYDTFSTNKFKIFQKDLNEFFL